MSKDDYFVVACRILAYLYACLKSDITPDEGEISPAKLDVEPKYWLYIMEHLQDEGYVSGIHIGRYLKEGVPEMRKDGSIRVHFTHDKEIGTARSKSGNNEEKTRSGVLHVGKDGIHIVPMFEKKE